MGFDIGAAFEKSLRRMDGKSSAGKIGSEERMREGEENLVKTLNKMYREYRDRQVEKPNYAEKYPIQEYRPDYPNVKSTAALKEEADATARAMFDGKIEAAETGLKEKIAALGGKAEDAAEAYRVNLNDAQSRAENAAFSAEGRIAANGLQGSSIAANLRENAQANAQSWKDSAYQSYLSTLEEKNIRIRSEEQKRDNALKTFEIASAAAAEKELKRLQRERDKAQGDYAKQSREEASKIEKENAGRGDKIKEDEAARNTAFKEKETAAEAEGKPYEGAKAAEMENRYRVAEDYYGTLPKAKALNLIMSSSEELKSLLGRHYERLIQTINNK